MSDTEDTDDTMDTRKNEEQAPQSHTVFCAKHREATSAGRTLFARDTSGRVWGLLQVWAACARQLDASKKTLTGWKINN